MKNQDPYGFLADLTAAPSTDPGWPEPIIGETRIFIASSLTSLHLHLRILVGQSLIKGEPGSLEPSPRNCHAVFQTAKVDLLVARRKESILLLHPDLGAETITSH